MYVRKSPGVYEEMKQVELFGPSTHFRDFFQFEPCQKPIDTTLFVFFLNQKPDCLRNKL